MPEDIEANNNLWRNKGWNDFLSGNPKKWTNKPYLDGYEAAELFHFQFMLYEIARTQQHG